jgi:hypothetical protein
MPINLNDLLPKVDVQELNITEPTTQEKVIIDWDGVLTEWSYRCQKGYPTMVDGVFTERDEVKILNEILSTYKLPKLELPQPSKSVLKEASFDIESSILKSKALNNNAKVSAISQKEGDPRFYTVYVSGIKAEDRGRIVKAVVNDLNKDLTKVKTQEPLRVLVKPNKDSRMIVFVGKTKYEFNFQVEKKETKTDTDAKEGFSVLFGYYPEEIEIFTTSNLKDEATKIKRYLADTKTNITGLPNSVVQKMIGYLDKAAKTTDSKAIKTYVSFLNQGLSHGRTFASFFEKNPDFYIERGDFFNKIRSAGSKVSKLPADKWCPGDVYFIKNGSESQIESILDVIDEMPANAPLAERAQNLSLLNSLFSPTFDGKVNSKTPIVAVSLKMAEAQAGKLKSGLEDYKKDIETDYNLTNEELKYPVKILQQKIKEQQKVIQLFMNAENNSGNSLYVWDPKFNVDEFVKKNPNPTGKSMEVLKFKYAGYKALIFIYEAVANKQPKEVDNALKSLVAFGLGLVSTKMEDVFINPPFFKVIANTDGSAMIDSAGLVRPQFFKPGSIVTLAPASGAKGKPIIHLKDGDNYKGFFIDMYLNVGTNKYEVSVTFRSNGTSQLTIELQKAHLIS